jgi:undecaprenyl-diphosphatase
MSPDEMLLIWLQTKLTFQYSDTLFYWISSRSGFSMPILLALLITAFNKEKWHGVGWWFALIFVVTIGDQFGNLLKALFAELRPCADQLQLLQSARDFTCSSVAKGMPSNHALTFYTASLFVFLTRRSWRGWHILLLTAALLTSLSRIYLAKHYPSQVVAGMFIGINIGVAAAWLYQVKSWLEPLIIRIENFTKLVPWHEQPHPSLIKRIRNSMVREASNHA